MGLWYVYAQGLFRCTSDVREGVWPAFWTLGALAQWPQVNHLMFFFRFYNLTEYRQAGEIDIIEGVHDNIHNHVAWHTEPGCVLMETGNYTGTVVRFNHLSCSELYRSMF